MKIALLGYGVEGESAYKYYSSMYSGAEFVIYDNAEVPKYEIPEGIEFIGSAKDLHGIDADIVVKTPAISPENVSSRGKITSVTREFFDVCHVPIIGVTGTKGKGTTCTLIAKMLESSGKKVWLVGNIGKPALDILKQIQDDDIVIYELSSFQLWDMEKSPETAVVLLVEPDHLNVHDTMDEYVQAKANIAKYQKTTDNMIYHPTNINSAEIANLSEANKQRYGTPEGAYVKGENIMISDQTICSVGDVGLLGAHNLENITAAVTAAWHYTHDTAAIAKVISEFKGLPHHTELVREIDGVKYYDDSFSSAPAATVAAIKSFGNPEIVIIGGSEKNANFDSLVEAIVQQNNIKKIIFIGETATRLSELCKAANESRYEIDDSGDFEKIINRAAELSEVGDVVLLSPGCPSFDMFNNFTHRGEEFARIVGKL